MLITSVPAKRYAYAYDIDHLLTNKMLVRIGAKTPGRSSNWAKSNYTCSLDTTLSPITLRHWVYGSPHLYTIVYA
jgi:hypothetical protein